MQLCGTTQALIRWVADKNILGGRRDRASEEHIQRLNEQDANLRWLERVQSEMWRDRMADRKEENVKRIMISQKNSSRD
jgi:hypothetical protein